jgi:hypothetical protein
MYTIGVDGNGKLTLLKDTERVIDGRSQVLGAPYVVIVGGVPGANNSANETNKNKQRDITDLANSLKSNEISALKSLPVTELQSFVFAGGETFAFKDARFSDNQDLVCHITYVTPEIYNAL